MNTEHKVRSRSLWGMDARPGPTGTAPRSLLPAALALGIALSARAQNPPLPPPAQAASALQQAVQQNPGLADMIRQRIAQSGITSDQVRARLQASGYPPTLLDAYLSAQTPGQDRKSTRLNSSHGYISYAVFCLKKKKKNGMSSRAMLRLEPPVPDKRFQIGLASATAYRGPHVQLHMHPQCVSMSPEQRQNSCPR